MIVKNNSLVYKILTVIPFLYLIRTRVGTSFDYSEVIVKRIKFEYLLIIILFLMFVVAGSLDGMSGV
jgi:hypothetical protein